MKPFSFNNHKHEKNSELPSYNENNMEDLPYDVFLAKIIEILQNSQNEPKLQTQEAQDFEGNIKYPTSQNEEGDYYLGI